MAAIALAVATTTTHARDASADDLSAADRATARTMLDEGYVQLSKGNAAGALKLFEGADAMMKVPTTKLAVARAQIATGMLVEASDTLTDLLRTPLAANAPPPFKRARADGEALLEQTSKRMPQVSFVIEGSGARNAEIRVDDQLVPAAALVAPRRVNPGKHVVVAKSGERSARASFDVAERDRQIVKLQIEAGEPAASAASAAPVTAALPADRSDADTGGPARTVAWIGGGVAVVGLAAGAISGLAALHSKQSALSSGRCVGNACPSSAAGDIDDAHQLATISTIAIGIGVAGAAVGIVALLWPSHHDRDPSGAHAHVRIVPSGLAGTF